MKTLRIQLSLILSLLSFNCALPNSQTTPKLTIIMVVDQFAYHYFYKLRPFFTGAFKLLLNEGIVFDNAHYPHAVPETSIGHTALNTGVYAKDHGIIGNSWMDQSGKEVECDDADAKTAAVFGKGCEMHTYGKSSAHIMVDGLSDQFAMQSQSDTPFLAFSISMKSRSAIATATKLGKAIWFDKETGLFTSSKAYFEQLPPWLINFNTKNKIDCVKEVTWDLVYPKTSPAYQFKYIDNYKYASEKEASVNKQKTINCCTSDHKEIYAPIYESPFGNTLLLNLARECLKANLTKKNKLLLWVCLTPLDLVGHHYGPDSLEAIDLIYHLDKQIKSFMQDVQSKVGKNNVVFALTADHGILPMQGIIQEEGLKTAYKIPVNQVMKDLNSMIQKKYSIDSFIIDYQPPQFFLDYKKKKQLDANAWNEIAKEIKEYLFTKPGIKNVWTYQELDILPLNPQQQELEYYFKNQRYPGRSGDIFVQTQPYSLLTAYDNGTSHASPYNYDTHVPLFIYQKGKYERKKVTKKVYMTQFANTMAQILDIPKPSASTEQLLPGVFEEVEEEEDDAEVKNTPIIKR